MIANLGDFTKIKWTKRIYSIILKKIVLWLTLFLSWFQPEANLSSVWNSNKEWKHLHKAPHDHPANPVVYPFVVSVIVHWTCSLCGVEWILVESESQENSCPPANLRFNKRSISKKVWHPLYSRVSVALWFLDRSCLLWITLLTYIWHNNLLVIFRVGPNSSGDGPAILCTKVFWLSHWATAATLR